MQTYALLTNGDLLLLFLVLCELVCDVGTMGGSQHIPILDRKEWEGKEHSLCRCFATNPVQDEPQPNLDLSLAPPYRQRHYPDRQQEHRL